MTGTDARPRFRVSLGLLIGALALMVASFGAQRAQAATHDVLAPPYSAAGDGVTNDRVAIQAAIDAAAAAGGGEVLLASGRTFRSGGVRLKRGVTLRIDGVLEQSPTVGHYADPPTLGHYGPGGDLANFTNLPLIFASGTSDVGVSGSGRIQMTKASGGLGATIQIAAIGFYQVTDFAIRSIDIDEAHVYHVMLYSTRRGLVDGIRINSPAPDPVTGAIEANTDGISLQNSSDIRITGNEINTDDDSLYIWSSYHDPRGGGRSWWTANPAPSRNIRIDNNRLTAGHNGHGFAFIAWGAKAPDQSQVEISDVMIEDNVIQGGPPYGFAVGCWCQDPYATAPWTGSGYGDQSPITRVTFRNNRYPQGQIRPMLISDLTTDFPMLSSGVTLNGDFGDGDAAWNKTGIAGVATRTTLPTALDTAIVRRAAERMDGRFGHLYAGSARGALSQVLGLGRGSVLTPLGISGSYRISGEVATGGHRAKLFVRNLCTGTELVGQEIPAEYAGRVTATFSLTANCGRVEVGVELAAGAYTGTWVLLDDFELKPPLMHALDPGILYAGYWAPHNLADEWRGSHMSSESPGQTATITFRGTRARIVGLRSNQIGIIRFSVDGRAPTTVDLYSPTLRMEQVLFDTGTLPYGTHTIRTEPTGTANPAATYTVFAFDGVLVDEHPLTVSRAVLTFDPLPVESVSAAKHVTLSADSTAVTLGDVTLAGAAAGQFALDASACRGRTLAAGSSCVVAVRFAPTADGDHAARLQIATGSGTREVTLTGSTPDGYPLAETYSDVIDDREARVVQSGAWYGLYQSSDGRDVGGYHLVGFDTSAVLRTSFSGTRATLWATTDFNLGTADVYVDGVHAGVADFYSPTSVLHANVWESGLLAPGPHTFELRTKTGLSVFDALLVRGGVTTSADRASVAFGTVRSGASSATERITITAAGAGRGKIGGVRLVGADAGQFAIVGATCARDLVLRAGDRCTVDVRFAPTRTGAASARVRIADTSEAGATVVPLSGSGS